MKASRNATFNLPVDLLRRAKVVAAQRDQSLNALVQQSIERSIDETDEDKEAARKAAVKRFLARAKKGLFRIPPGGIKREDAYEGRILR